MNITLRQLQAFIAVAIDGNFTRAAQRLHIAQSAVSVLVRELEAELRVRLFDRTTRRVELTEAGREFRGSAEKLIADLEYAVRNTHDLVERKRGRFTVAAPPLLAAALLPPVVASFARDYPGVRVTLLDAGTDQIVARVKSGEADIGVGTFAADDEGLARVRLARDTLMLFCQSSHALAAVTQPGWSALRDAPLITLTPDSGIRALVDQGYQAAGIEMNIAFEVSQISTALALVEVGLGVSVLPAYAMAWSPSAGIAARPLAEPQISREVAVIMRSFRSLPPSANEFIQRLQQNARIFAPDTAN
ncbi:MAG: LysR family transcriptional regulator [Alphaproteobacteria bacterium]|jgi:DNA-binding transcriptional LysR family regulator|nr:LysR family transcriptional regulator [Alphaproteobacteria bacterium]